MRSFKKLMTVLMLVLVCTCLLAVSAFAAEEVASGYCGDSITWVLDDSGTLTISGMGDMYDYYDDDYPGWYNYLDLTYDVVITDGVTSVGAYAFYDCSYITSVTLPDTLEEIGYGAFVWCNNLPEITLPDSLEIIDSYAFGSCHSLTEIEIPANVEWVSSSAFRYCSELSAIYVDAGNSYYTNDEYGVLYDKEMDMLIKAPGAFSGDYTVPAGVECIGEYAFEYSLLSGITLPESVTSISACAFSWCEALEDVTLPDSLDSIGYEAFYFSGITEIVIPEYVTYIGDDAFSGSALNTITFLGDAPSMYYIFGEVTATAYYPAGNSTWTEDVMEECYGDITWIPAGEIVDLEVVDDLLCYVVGDTIDLDDIKINAVYDNGAKIPLDPSALEIDAVDMTTVGQKPLFVFYDGMIAEITVAVHESKIYTLVDSSLYPESEHEYDCDLDDIQTITVPGAEELDLTFSLDTYVENRYDNIYIYDFNDNLIATFTGGEAAGVTVTVPGNTAKVRLSTDYSVTNYGYAFDFIEAYRYSHVGDASGAIVAATCTEPGYSGGVYCEICGVLAGQSFTPALGHNYKAVVTEPTPTVNGYTTHTCTRCGDSYTDSETMYGMIAFGTCGENLTWTLSEEGILTISGTGEMDSYYDDYAPWHDYHDQILSAVVENGVTYIGAYAFEDCFYLETVDISDSVETIAYSAFCYCESLTEVTIPASVTRIGEATFYGCDSLTGIWVDADNEYYSSDASGVLFYGDKVELIKAPMMLSGKYTVPATVEYIWPDAFSRCEDLTAVTLPNSLYGIGESAFQYCTGLSSVVLPDSLDWIGEGMFDGCTALTSVKLPANLTYIPDGIFYDCVSLTEIDIPDTVDEIGSSAFAHSGLKSVSLPSGFIGIYSYGFACCEDLTSIYIPSSMDYISDDVFYGCDSLTDVYYGGTQSQWDNIYIGSENENLTEATIHYNSVAQPKITKLENTASGIKITWGAVDGAGKYRVYVKTSTGWLNVGTTTATSFTYTGAKSGYTYTFTVRCLNAAGNAFISGFNTTGWSQKYVAQPAISKLENTASGIKLTWNAVAGAGKYRVYAKTSTGWLALGTTTATTFTYTGAKSGYTYTFTVRAMNAAGTAFVSSFNTTGWSQKYVAQPAISKLENTATGIKLTWNAVAGAGKYRIYAKTSKGWLALGTTTANTFTYTGAKSGYTYTFTVRAMNAAGTAFVSSFNTTGWKQTYVAQPAISKLENTASGIKITWNGVAGAGKYRVYAKTSTGWLALGTTTGTSFVYTGAKSGYTYTFTIRAMNASGTAFVSSFNTTGWRYKFVAQPTVTKLTNTTSGINVTWGAVSGAEAYRVFVKTSTGWVAVGTTTGTSFLWTGAKAGYTYTFTVRAMNAAGTAYTSAFNATGWSIKRT